MRLLATGEGDRKFTPLLKPGQPTSPEHVHTQQERDGPLNARSVARYLNNIPVDVMRGALGVDTVIVVDVEDKDASVWRNLTSYEGGISGWRLLWDRWCPIPSLR